MKYLSKFKIFRKKGDAWKEKFNQLYNLYLSNKNKKISSIHDINLPEVEINHDYFYIYGLLNKNNEHIVFYGNTGRKNNYEVVDFSINDYSNPNDRNGVYPISIGEYNLYRNKCIEINNWLDNISEESEKKSKSIVSSDNISINIGEIDSNEDKINEHLIPYFEEYIGKKLEFELSYHIWSSDSKNKLDVNRFDLRINDIKFKIGGDRIYCNLFVEDPINKSELSYIWIEKDSPTKYFSFDDHKWPYIENKKDYLVMYKYKEGLTRKEKRDSIKNPKYPFVISYNASPSKYDSISLIEKIVDVLTQINLEK